MTKFISNDQFKYLSPKDREYLKKDYKNYLYINNIYYHYIQDTNEYYFNKHLAEIEAMHIGNINIYMSYKLGIELKLIKEETTYSLF